MAIAYDEQGNAYEVEGVSVQNDVISNISEVYIDANKYLLNDADAEEKIAALQSGKVDKVDGKGLSTNDYTTTEKTKLSGIEEQANKTIVDSVLSDTSTNPVQNKVVKGAVTELNNNKVDKVTGKGLSTNDYTNVEKTRANAIERRTRRNITTDLSNLSTAIAEQNLEKYGYAIGDYFNGASGYTYHLADMDTYYGGYNNYAVVNRHHCGIVVDTKSSSQWYTSNSAPRYDSSTLHSFLSGTALNNVKSDMIALFGGSSGLEHLVAHNMLANGIGTWGWSGDNYIRAMTEVEVYGSRVWSADGYQQGEAVKKLTLFDKFRFNEIIGNTWWWLRSLYSSSNACCVINNGRATNDGLTSSGRAVGLILFY